MSLFILVYLAIYGGAHGYVLSRLVQAFRLGAPWPTAFLALSLFMVCAPILVRILERYGAEPVARLVAWLGYLWMGFFFLLFSASLTIELVRAMVAAAGWVAHRELLPPLAASMSVALLLALAASLYGLFEARSIRVSRVTLRSAKIPASAGRVRIVQISDVHLGLMVGKAELQRILDKITPLEPDLLVSTGDLVDGQMDGLKGLDGMLAAVKAPLGKFAVLGNHEVFAGIQPSATFTSQAGLRLLSQEVIRITPFLAVAGVDDPAVRRREPGALDSDLLAALPEGTFTLLLKHRPSVEQAALGYFDLQLSGHVHKGQIFPFNLITRLAYPVKMGLSHPGGRSWLYVSRGTGTWGPPLRVLAPPEVTVIDLLPA